MSKAKSLWVPTAQAVMGCHSQIPMGIPCDLLEKKNNRQNKRLWEDFGVRKKDLFYHKLLICTFMIFVHSQYLHCMYLVEISGFA